MSSSDELEGAEVKMKGTFDDMFDGSMERSEGVWKDP